MVERSSFSAVIIFEGTQKDGHPLSMAFIHQWLEEKGIKNSVPWNSQTPIVIEFKVD